MWFASSTDLNSIGLEALLEEQAAGAILVLHVAVARGASEHKELFVGGIGGKHQGRKDEVQQQAGQSFHKSATRGRGRPRSNGYSDFKRMFLN